MKDLGTEGKKRFVLKVGGWGCLNNVDCNGGDAFLGFRGGYKFDGNIEILTIFLGGRL